jgi:hypothetical protein
MPHLRHDHSFSYRSTTAKTSASHRLSCDGTEAVSPAARVGEVETSVDKQFKLSLKDEVLFRTEETFLDLALDVRQPAANALHPRYTLVSKRRQITSACELDLLREGDNPLVTHLGLRLRD